MDNEKITPPNLNEYWEGIKNKTIHQQEAKMLTYHALLELELPIPPDLDGECSGHYASWKAARNGDNRS